MSDGPAATSTVHPLRPTFCPNCDYSREGLADGAACPECGMRIDSSFVILQDDIGEETEPAIRKRRRWFVTVLSLLFVAFVAYRFFVRGRLGTLLWIWPVVIFLSLAGWHQLVAWRRSHMQLWLHERGFELIASTEEARRIKRISRLIHLCFAPLMFLLIGISSGGGDVALVFGAIGVGFLLLIAGIGWVVRRINPQLTVQSGDFVRTLTPWSAVREYQINQPLPGRAFLRFQRVLRLAGPLDLSREWVQIDAPLEDDAYNALSTRIFRWTQGAGRTY